MIDWKRKLTSRKWWLAVSVFVVGCITLFGVETGTAEKFGALIMMAADVFGYSLAEGLVDSANNE